MSYAALLAVPLSIAALVVVIVIRTDRRTWLALAMAAGALLALTVVFDSIMIAVDLFRFEDQLLFGARVWLAPVEDLAYALVALFVVVAIWRTPGARRSPRAHPNPGSPRGGLEGDTDA